jgi:hypothetical protein
MDNYQQQAIIKKIKSAYPKIWGSEDMERRQLFLQTFKDCEYNAFNNKLDLYIIGNSRMPTVADMSELARSCMPTVAVTTSTYCKICDNTGWKFIDDTGHGTVVQCPCGKLD